MTQRRPKTVRTVAFLLAALIIAAAALVVGSSRATAVADIGYRLAPLGADHLRVTVSARALGGWRSLPMVIFLPARPDVNPATHLTARLDGRPCPVFRLGRLVGVFTAGRRGRLELSYEIDPTWFPPGTTEHDRLHAKSRLDQDLGFIRMAAVLLRPGGAPPGDTHLTFDLPGGWQEVTPWPADGDHAYVLKAGSPPGDAYVALGPLNKTEMVLSGGILRVAAAPGVSRESAEDMAGLAGALFDKYTRMMGGPPDVAGESAANGAGRTYSIALFPARLLGGGAAGPGNLITVPDQAVLAHEVFHWWNGQTTRSARELSWLGEGWTEYIALRTLRDLGVWTEDAYRSALEQRLGAYQEAYRAHPVGLGEASRRAWKDGVYWNLVYNGGLAVAARWDAEPPGGLDRLLPLLASRREDPITPEQLKGLIQQAWGEDLWRTRLADDWQRFVDGTEAVPESADQR